MLIFCSGVVLGVILYSLSAFVIKYFQLPITNKDFETPNDDYPFTP